MTRILVLAMGLLALGCASRESRVATYGPPPPVREPTPSPSEELALIVGDVLTEDEQELLFTIHETRYDPPAGTAPPPVGSGLQELLEQEGEAILHEKVDYDIPIVINDRVMWWIDYFAYRVPGTFERYLIRSGAWVPYLKERLREAGLPEDLVYLALIESGFSTQARSHAGAVGPWQFMPYTGREYGLRIDRWVDERRDYERATDAAIAYLQDLHSWFASWYLSAAGYNGGQGRVGRSMARDNTINFWELTGLHSETQNYVPKLIAATIIAKDPEAYGFYDVPYLDPMEWETVTVPTSTDLTVVARAAGVPLETIRSLNPHLLRDRTPPGESNFPVKIPRGRADRFNEQYYALAPQERVVEEAVHIVRRGETLRAIAAEYDVSVQDLIDANDIPNPNRLRAGQRIAIPGRAAGAQQAAQGLWQPSTQLNTPAQAENAPREVPREEPAAEEPAREEPAAEEPAAEREEPAGESSEPVIHVVDRGDTLTSIGRRYGVRIADIKRENGLQSDNIRIGQRLRIPRS